MVRGSRSKHAATQGKIVNRKWPIVNRADGVTGRQLDKTLQQQDSKEEAMQPGHSFRQALVMIQVADRAQAIIGAHHA
jgi:hypothetical protein